VITDNNSDIMTVREVADYLKIAEKTAYRLVLDKKIPGFKVGNAWRFRKKEIEDWIVNQTKGSASIKIGGVVDAN
jgi:excisionase family DNA binding protein